MLLLILLLQLLLLLLLILILGIATATDTAIITTNKTVFVCATATTAVLLLLVSHFNTAGIGTVSFPANITRCTKMAMLLTTILLSGVRFLSVSSFCEDGKAKRLFKNEAVVSAVSNSLAIVWSEMCRLLVLCCLFE